MTFLFRVAVLLAGASVVGCEPGSGASDTTASAQPAIAVRQASAPAAAVDTAAFYKWWVDQSSSTFGEAEPVPAQVLPPGVGRTHIPLLGLAAPAPNRVSRPPTVQGEQWQPRALYERGSQTVLLWIPTDTAGRFGGAGTCGDNRSFIGVAPGGEWAALELNPYCDDASGPDEADVFLYSLPGEPWPHVEIVTNGAACIPSALYRYDAAARRYVRARAACAS